MSDAKGTATQPLRVSVVDYLNARPLFSALADDPRVALTRGLPSEVAREIAEDEADCALLPVAAAADLGGLDLLPVAAIGSRGPVGSVLLVSEAPLADLDTVALDLSSRTSVVLARLLLRRMGLSPRFVGLPAAEALAAAEGRTGAVVIGDPALQARAKYTHVLDLASAWMEWTGLPFVFAAWFARPGTVSEGSLAMLRGARDRGKDARPSLAREHAQATGLAEDALVTYLNESIRYELGEAELAGLARFYDEAHAAGLLPRAEVKLADVAAAPAARPPSLDGLLARAFDGDRLSGDEALRLYREASLFDLGACADEARKRRHPSDVVTYIVDRNVNYTNVCTTSCRFCAFYRPVGHAEGYVLSRAQLAEKLSEVVRAGGVQILLQGGLNPELPLEWYEDLFRWIKSEFALGLHALSPEEILFLSQLSGLTVPRVLERLRAAGLDSVPGGGAEILVDRVRKKIAKAKCTSAEWLGVMRSAHQLGLRSSCTMMYGTTDDDEDRILHLLKLRGLQDETGGFTAFFCWDFQYEEGTRVRPGDTGTLLYLRTQAIARLVLDNVEHVGSSWVTQGPAVGQVALRFGADDLGSVMFEENVVSSAGTTFRMDATGMEQRIHDAGFRAARRNVRYEWLTEPR
ncbi:MAG: dehypoxanthine futalosine cyclase [Myxococcales bacterium]|jgi:cyclic dehypoxanthinyl futalosine synthase|nr:dehypoxanthine futalosine cyclase [Myxococcales bacterium]